MTWGSWLRQYLDGPHVCWLLPHRWWCSKNTHTKERPMAKQRTLTSTKKRANYFMRHSSHILYRDPCWRLHAVPRSGMQLHTKQVLQAIQNLAPYKAPSPNGICNVVFIKCSDILVPWMGHLFWVTFTLNHFPNEWLTSKTVIICKPGCPDYGLPKAYQPIALLNTMLKILSACIAEKWVWIVTEHNLLPTTHFSGLPGRSTTDFLHLLTKFTHDAWAHPTDNYISILFMDVKAAFPSVVPECLFHNMHSCWVPEEYINWYKMCMTGRATYHARIQWLLLTTLPDQKWHQPGMPTFSTSLSLL